MANFRFESQSRHSRTLEIPLASCEGLFCDLRRDYHPVATYVQAQKDWDKAFGSKNLHEEVQRLLSVPKENLKEELLWIKSLRKPGTRLVDIYRLLDQTHTAPRELADLVTTIGEFKDMAKYPNQISRSANILTSKTDLHQANSKTDFTPASYESFETVYQSYLTDITKFLAMDPLTLHFYHKLRYRVRTLRHYFSVHTAATNCQLSRNVSEFLAPVSVEMGKVQDQIHSLKMKGHTDIYTDTTLLDQKHRHIILTFLDLHPTK